MKENNFVFADLSTYNLEVAKKFYTTIFNWSFTNDTTNYFTAKYNKKEVCGLYKMPQKFKDMKMPSFWMSYIEVNNLDDTIKKARSLGGIIELVDKNQAIGKIALIRDPLGAGFTIYEGNLLNSRFENEENSLVWNELFISNFLKIKPFYEGIFNWTLEPTKDNRYYIKNNRKEKIGAIQEISNTIKGEKEYWSVFFGVKNISETKIAVLNNGGSIIYEDATTTVLADPFDAFFHIVLLQKQLPVKSQNSSKDIKWKAILGILLIILSLLYNWNWLWGIFFTLWVISDLISGFTHLFEPISRKEHPILYWAVLSTWAFLAVYSIAYYTI